MSCYTSTIGELPKGEGDQRIVKGNAIAPLITRCIVMYYSEFRDLKPWVANQIVMQINHLAVIGVGATPRGTSAVTTLSTDNSATFPHEYTPAASNSITQGSTTINGANDL